MVTSAALAFGLNYILYINWQIQNTSWIMLAVKTFTIFGISMITYIVFAAIFKIEYVGELIERIRTYIRQKFIK